MVRKRIVAALAAAALGMTLAGCGGSGGSGGGGAGGAGTLTLGVTSPPSSMIAANAFWSNDTPFLQAIYDTLLRETPDGEVEPWLATEYSYNADNTVLTMKLRTDVKFSDGTPFTADVAAQNILRFRDGTSISKSSLANVKDATAVDASTLEITLTEPDPTLLVSLAQNPGLQESPKSFGAADEETDPIGSGPYVLDTSKTVVGSKYVYTKNPDYWAPDDQHYNTLVLNVYQTAATQITAIQGRQVDAVNLIDNSGVKQIQAAGYTLLPYEGDWQGLALFDRNGALNPALGDVRVRQAINYAIDREALLKTENGFGTVTGQVFPTTSPGYDETLNDRYPYDPAKAKELLSEAGYAKGLTIEMPLFKIGSTAPYDLTKQYLADVGITVNFTSVPLTDAIAQLVQGKFAASQIRLQMYKQPYAEANFLMAPNAQFNPFKTTDPKVESLIQTIQTGSEDEAAAAAKDLNTYVVEQAWFDPWYRFQQNFASGPSTSVQGQADNPFPYLWNIKPKS